MAQRIHSVQNKRTHNDVTSDHRYTFGDGDAADRRLEHIASYFNVAAEAFLRRHLVEPVGIALDIGCGPGHTTRMLCQALAARQVAGLDVSEDFLRRATARLPDCRFLRHDIRITPLPVAPDLIYSRFVLSHLPDAHALVDRWVHELLPGGRLILDELEDIETDVPVLRRYLDVSGGLVASQGSDLWVGAALGAASYAARIVVNETERLKIPNHLAAAWFHPNTVTIWEREPFVLNSVGTQERKEISASLAFLRDTGEPPGHAVWIMRRMILMPAD